MGEVHGMNGMPAGTRVCQSLLGQRDIAEKMSMQLFRSASLPECTTSFTSHPSSLNSNISYLHVFSHSSMNSLRTRVRFCILCA